MRISDWSSDVCSSDLSALRLDCREILRTRRFGEISHPPPKIKFEAGNADANGISCAGGGSNLGDASDSAWRAAACDIGGGAERRQSLCRLNMIQPTRSEEHTSELQSLMRISYAVFCLKKK